MFQEERSVVKHKLLKVLHVVFIPCGNHLTTGRFANQIYNETVAHGWPTSRYILLYSSPELLPVKTNTLGGWGAQRGGKNNNESCWMLCSVYRRHGLVHKQILLSCKKLFWTIYKVLLLKPTSPNSWHGNVLQKVLHISVKSMLKKGCNVIQMHCASHTVNGTANQKGVRGWGRWHWWRRYWWKHCYSA
jgi:hypothetical protein